MDDFDTRTPDPLERFNNPLGGPRPRTVRQDRERLAREADPQPDPAAQPAVINPAGEVQ